MDNEVGHVGRYIQPSLLPRDKNHHRSFRWSARSVAEARFEHCSWNSKRGRYIQAVGGGSECRRRGTLDVGNSGFRFEGKALQAFSIRGTQNILIQNRILLPYFQPVFPLTVRAPVRPIAGLGVGLGWGKYLACNHYYCTSTFPPDTTSCSFGNKNVVR